MLSATRALPGPTVIRVRDLIPGTAVDASWRLRCDRHRFLALATEVITRAHSQVMLLAATVRVGAGLGGRHTLIIHDPNISGLAWRRPLGSHLWHGHKSSARTVRLRLRGVRSGLPLHEVRDRLRLQARANERLYGAFQAALRDFATLLSRAEGLGRSRNCSSHRWCRPAS